MVARSNRNRPLPEAVQPRAGDNNIQRAFDLLFIPLREIVRFLQPFVQAEKWRKAELQNSFENYSTEYHVAQFRKDPLGTVHIRGLVKRSAASTANILTLPVGYRPSKVMSFTTTADNNWARINISTDGSVRLNAATSATWFNYVFLDNISFDTVNE